MFNFHHFFLTFVPILYNTETTYGKTQKKWNTFEKGRKRSKNVSKCQNIFYIKSNAL